MTDETLTPLRPGRFYWVRPHVDVAAAVTPPAEAPVEEVVAHWSNKDQPARFEGVDDSGRQVWRMLGREATTAAIEWVGAAIMHPTDVIAPSPDDPGPAGAPDSAPSR